MVSNFIPFWLINMRVVIHVADRETTRNSKMFSGAAGQIHMKVHHGTFFTLYVQAASWEISADVSIFVWFVLIQYVTISAVSCIDS